MNGTLTIVLPYPARELSPNARCHWAAKSRAVKKARADAKIAAQDAMRRHGWKTVEAATVRATFFHPKTVRRDGDNFIAMLKPLADGITDAGVIENDCGFTYAPPTFTKDKDRRVELRIETPTTESEG